MRLIHSFINSSVHLQIFVACPQLSEHSLQPAYFDTSICQSQYPLSATLFSVLTTPDQVVCEVTCIFTLPELGAENGSDSYPEILVMSLVSSRAQLLCKGQAKFSPVRSFPLVSPLFDPCCLWISESYLCL